MDGILFLITAFAVAMIIALVVLHFIFKRRAAPRYSAKDSLLTSTERKYYDLFVSFFGEDYLVLPQINLATVIDKEGGGYRSELFRNVDFGIFDFNFRPLVLIEINDGTHLRPDRARRDEKVNLICKKAHIPLVTFWTKDGIDRQEIYKALKKYL